MVARRPTKHFSTLVDYLILLIVSHVPFKRAGAVRKETPTVCGSGAIMSLCSRSSVGSNTHYRDYQQQQYVQVLIVQSYHQYVPANLCMYQFISTYSSSVPVPVRVLVLFENEYYELPGIHEEYIVD